MKSYNPARHSICAAILVLLLASGCSSNVTRISRQQLLENPGGEGSTLGQTPNFSIQLFDGSTKVYDELTNTGSLQMEDGKRYNLRVITQASNLALSVAVDSTEPKELKPGDNPLQLFGISNKTLKITASMTKAAPRVKNYHVGVTCTLSEMAGFSVSGAGITVTPANENNLFNYSASGVATGGSGSYECAWDFNGDGIRDGSFGSCTENVSSVYSNHVGERTVSVMVRDTSCNRVLVASAVKNLGSYPSAWSLPQPQVYVHANVRSSVSPSDRRLNLKHLSSNMTGIPSRAQCSYTRANGKGTYIIAGMNRYGAHSQPAHGLVVSFQNLIDNVNVATKTGTIDSSGAQIASVAFATDQSSDSLSQLRFEGSTPYCTGSIAAIPKNVIGNECAGGEAEGVEGSYTITAEGNFSCLNLPSSTAAGQKVDITEGSFFCEFTLVDQCIGKGGSEGGTPPIQL